MLADEEHVDGDEADRLEALRRYDILDTPPDGTFDRITALAARLFDVPIAIVSVVDEDRIWFKSHHGLAATEVGRDPGLCASAIMQAEPWLVSDARSDPRALANPLVAGELGLQFYAGAPLTTGDGYRLGTLCIIDQSPRVLTSDEVTTLQDLAAVVVDELELRLASRRVAERENALLDYQMQTVQDMADVTMSIRELSASQDPAAARPEICRIALYLTGAESAAILELGDDDLTLVQTVTAGVPWATPDTLLTDLTAPAARAFTRGKAVLVTDIEPPLEAYGMPAGSTVDPYLTFWQPFAAGGRSPVAVLALAWHTPMEVFPVRLTKVMEVLAVEAMAAIERADLLAQVEALARTDELTGLPNRRVINEELPRELERSRREGRPVCVAMLDIDHFKRFNDTHGHPAGDRLLAAAAATWRNALRGGTDLLARFGGEEFLVVLPAPMDGAFETVQRLRTSTPEDQTVSAGVAEWDGEESPDQLVARADRALYAAKVAGRDRVERAPKRRRRPVRVQHSE